MWRCEPKSVHNATLIRPSPRGEGWMVRMWRALPRLRFNGWPSLPTSCGREGQLLKAEAGGARRWGALEEAGALPWLAEDVLGQEGEDGLVPDPRVAGSQDPVVLVGEVEELGLGAVAVQVRPQPQRLADRHPVVLVPVDDQHRRADLGDVAVR